MERIRTRSAIGINTTALRNWGALFLIVGIIGKCILQDRLAGLNHQDLLAVMEGPTWMLLCAILGILMQLLEACAIPIFAYLLVEGFRRTGNLKKYILRLLAAAILSELPYNLAYGGRLLDISSRNPVFAMVLGLVLLYFYSAYPEKKYQKPRHEGAADRCHPDLGLYAGHPVRGPHHCHRGSALGLPGEEKGPGGGWGRCGHPLQLLFPVYDRGSHGLSGGALMQRGTGGIQPEGLLPVLPHLPDGGRSFGPVPLRELSAAGDGWAFWAKKKEKTGKDCPIF